MDNKKIVLLKMPTGKLGEVGQSFIGMLVISQLLKTVFLRADTPERERKPFVVYCDEFQNFATPDFAKLFTQTRKFKIMPVVAHQHREQFKPGDPAKTLSAPNKVLFNLTSSDAREFAVEVAKNPPMGIRQEWKLWISQRPVDDLLMTGHTNPEIRRFVNQYLRPMQERMEDIKEEMEGGKLIRIELEDEAAASRLEAQIEGADVPIFRDYSEMEKSLTNARELITRARYETNALQGLHWRASSLRQIKRFFNHFLTAVMEEQITSGQEQFANFLIDRTRESTLISKEHAKVIELYIQLMYGDPQIPRVIPFDLAREHGLFPQDVNSVLKDLEEKEELNHRSYLKYRLAQHFLDDYRNLAPWRLEPPEKAAARITEAIRTREEQLADWNNNIKVKEIFSLFTKNGWFSCENGWLLCRNYMFFHRYPALQTLLKPYLARRLAPSWQAVAQSLDVLIHKSCEALSSLSDASEEFTESSLYGKVFVKEHLGR